MIKSLITTGFSILTIFSMLSCSNSNNKQQKITGKEFHIKGKVTNLSDGATVYLMSIGDLKYETLDSIKVENGNFSFIGIPDEEKLYLLNLGDKIRVPLFLNKGEINIEANADDPRNEAKITGSPYTDQLHAFNNLTRRLENVLFEMEADYSALARAGKEKEMDEQGKLIEKTAQSQLIF